MFMSESSVTYSESCECDFVTSQDLVGGAPREWDSFKICIMCKHVVMLKFPESKPWTVDVLYTMEEVRM